MNYVKEYYEKIITGEITTSRRVKAVYQRTIEEMEKSEEKDYPFYFSASSGERIIEFVENFCKQSQGLIGEPLILDLWQKSYLQLLFGWLEKETDYRRYYETMLMVGRKNGKSTLLSAVALYMLTSDYEGAAEIYSIATKKDQAKKVLTEAINMVKQSPDLREVIKKRRNDMYFPATSSVFEALASDSNTMDGLNTHLGIIDELHAIRDRKLYEVIKQSMSARRQPLLMMITTNGTVRECIFDDKYEYACKIVDGEEKDDRFLALLYELDDIDEWTNPCMWQKANPGLGTIKDYKKLTSAVETAKKDPKELPAVLCKDFNIKATDSKVWLSFKDIENKSKFELKDVYNTYAVGGCDLSATTDLTCASLLIRKKNDESIYVLQQYFLPQARIDKLDEKNTNEAPYKIWADRGLLTICKGNRVNYTQVTEWFLQMQEQYKIDPIYVGYDRALAGYWIDEMKSNGFRTEAVAQGSFTWSQPMKEMGAAFSDKKVNYNNNPILKWCLTNTAVKKSGLNNIQPVKITDKRRIDGAVSLLNAWVLYIKYYEDYMYEVG